MKFEDKQVTAQASFRADQAKTNAHGVTAPVRPRNVTAATTGSFNARLKRVTTKYKESIESLATR